MIFLLKNYGDQCFWFEINVANSHNQMSYEINCDPTLKILVSNLVPDLYNVNWNMSLNYISCCFFQFLNLFLKRLKRFNNLSEIVIEFKNIVVNIYLFLVLNLQKKIN